MKRKWLSAIAVALSAGFMTPAGGQTFSDWTTPVNLGPGINSSGNDV